MEIHLRTLISYKFHINLEHFYENL